MVPPFQVPKRNREGEKDISLTFGFTPNSMGGTGSTESTWISTPFTGGMAPCSLSVPSDPFLFFRERSLPMGPGLCSLLCPGPCSESLMEKQRG